MIKEITYYGYSSNFSISLIEYSIIKKYSELIESIKKPLMGMKEFHPIVKNDLKSTGVNLFYMDGEIKGIYPKHASKPDYIMELDNVIIIGEIKSPSEIANYSMSKYHKADSKLGAAARLYHCNRVRNKEVDRKVGYHEGIINGQIVDYKEKLGDTYNSPTPIKGKIIKGGYTVPLDQEKLVIEALKNCGKEINKIDTNGKSITFIFDF